MGRHNSRLHNMLQAQTEGAPGGRERERDRQREREREREREKENERERERRGDRTIAYFVGRINVYNYIIIYIYIYIYIINVHNYTTDCG